MEYVMYTCTCTCILVHVYMYIVQVHCTMYMCTCNNRKGHGIEWKQNMQVDTIRLLTDPQPSTLDRSLPVPRGSTATGGKGLMDSSSMIESTQPTVPSPPQARIRTSLRSWNIWRLMEGERGREGGREWGREGGRGRERRRDEGGFLEGTCTCTVHIHAHVHVHV